MKKDKINTLIAILTAAIMLLIPIAALATDPPAPLAKTGQTTSYLTSDDGDLQKGVASPDPRFTDNGDETVTDNLTGLMWAKDANMVGTMTWSNVIAYANNLSLGSGSCGTNYTDWRLPNRKELESLVDSSNYLQVLPTGHPFSNVQSSYYWSSTTFAYYSVFAWFVDMGYGSVFYHDKTSRYYVWPVRSDN